MVPAEELRPDDFVVTDGSRYGDEVVDRVERGVAITLVWYAGCVRPVAYHPRDLVSVVNR